MECDRHVSIHNIKYMFIYADFKGQVGSTRKPEGRITESQCKDDDCLFGCDQFNSKHYCGCPLGFQLVDKG